MHWTKQKVQPQSLTSTFSQKADCSADPAEWINDSIRHERICKLFLIAQFKAYYQLIRYWYLFKNKNYNFFFFFLCVCPIHIALYTDQAWDRICIVPWLQCHAACMSRHCSVLRFPPMQHSEIYSLQIQVPVFKELFLWGTTTQAQDSRLWVEHLSLVDMLHFLRKHLHKEPQRGMSNLRETGLRKAEHLWPAAQGPLVLLHTNFQWWTALITLCGDHHQTLTRQLTFQWRLML